MWARACGWGLCVHAATRWCRCCGVGGWNAPCQAADTNNGLTSDTEKLCKALDKKKAPAKKTGATGGVAKSKAAGKAAAGKAKQAV